MQYKKLVNKMAHTQSKIWNHLKHLNDFSELPPDLVEKAALADEWLDSQRDRTLGEIEAMTMSPNLDPILDYTNSLIEYRDMFPENARSESDEFEELTQELFELTRGIEAQ